MNMKHVFHKGTRSDAPLLLMLHGTGGNEEDLLPLAQMIDDSEPVLGVRGNVLENGMPRFFRRLAEGIFDETDLLFRTQEMLDFLDDVTAVYGLDRRNIIAVGYSNGANIAASLLFHQQDALRGAILHHPMVPLRGVGLPKLKEVPLFIGAGKRDSICPPEETEELSQLFVGSGADVTVHWEPGGHQLTRSEVEQATSWYRKRF